MESTDNPALPLHFGTWLARLVERLEAQEKEIQQLKERLTRLEPIEAPLTPEQFCKRHPIKPGTMRDWLFHRATNGLAQCGAVVKKGRRLYLYETSFLRWVRETEPSDRRRFDGQFAKASPSSTRFTRKRR
jgi:hypothetical protein